MLICEIAAAVVIVKDVSVVDIRSGETHTKGLFENLLLQNYDENQ